MEHHQKLAAYDNYEIKKKHLIEALNSKAKKAEKATKSTKKASKSEASIAGAKLYFTKKKQKKLQKAEKAIKTRLENLDIIEKVKKAPSLKTNLPNEDTFKDRIFLSVQGVTGGLGNRVLRTKQAFMLMVAISKRL